MHNNEYDRSGGQQQVPWQPKSSRKDANEDGRGAAQQRVRQLRAHVIHVVATGG